VKAAAESRLERRFKALRDVGRGGLVTFITAGDPDPETGFELFRRLPDAGADIIELGIAFTDPMADGPAVQAANLRALAAGATLAKTLDMVRRFRTGDDDTPVILMGYFNPVYSYGVDRFLTDALSAGVDGLIMVDMPPEEDVELCLPALGAGIAFIRLATPTTDDNRLPMVLRNTSGFVYYVPITGITGTTSAAAADIEAAVNRLRQHTDLPIAVGFGIKTPDQAAAVARVADAAVVGSAIVSRIAENLDERGTALPQLADSVLGLVNGLAEGVRGARTSE